MGTHRYPTAYDKDLYAVLQISPRASVEVADAAYKALLKQYAPRAANDTDHRAQLLGEAHVILSDPSERRKYDAYRSERAEKLIGPYRIMHKVAEGGFGTTYKAEHVEFGGFSCIKHCSEISPLAEELLKQETKAIWDLRHFCLPAMRDFLRLEDGGCALAMSWVDGLTLQQAVEKHGKLNPEDVAWITARTINALWHLHMHGIVHGDIKPQNLIGNDKTHEAVLVDFGLSQVKPTKSTRGKGYTELFAPPEQMEGKPLLPVSDFYSLGMTMIYALSGSIDATAKKRVPVDVPDPLCDFIKKLVVRDVFERPRDAKALFDEIRDLRLQVFGREHSDMRQFSA